MKITERALFDNGWKKHEKGYFYKRVSDVYEVRYVSAWGDLDGWVFLACNLIENSDGVIALPNVDTLEKLSQLEYLLSPYVVMDTAPIDTAIRARFAEGGGSDL